jgi:hypothetical protein
MQRESRQLNIYRAVRQEIEATSTRHEHRAAAAVEGLSVEEGFQGAQGV